MFSHVGYSRATAAVQNFIRPSVLWMLVVITLSVSGALVGISIQSIASSTQNTPGNSSDAKCTDSPRFYSLVSSFFLQTLSAYCHLVPILDDHMRRKDIDVHHYVFYVSILASMLAAVLAPILYCRSAQGPELSVAMNFLANIFDVVTATQLAGGIMKLNR
ncbi:hypothetical protein BJ166DRAFT_585267 [Pestalotiopsis sp. NC0098]|nr:hypothetical protein BJ166DRAFT_585267 [Pestalotiopsis sp. NC0098]